MRLSSGAPARPARDGAGRGQWGSSAALSPAEELCTAEELCAAEEFCAAEGSGAPMDSRSQWATEEICAAEEPGALPWSSAHGSTVGLQHGLVETALDAAGREDHSEEPWLSTFRTGPRERARYGLRACRIGEASHPGPPRPGTIAGDDDMQALATDRRARLRHVIWQAQRDPPELPPGGPPELVRSRIVQPHRSVKSAASLIATLARGCMDLPPGHIPRDVHEQRWSALNVPIIWQAAGDEDLPPVVQWLAAAATGAPQVDIGASPAQEASVAVTDGFRALRRRFRHWGITCKEELGPRLRELGLHSRLVLVKGQYLSQALQEAILERAVAEDIGVAALEAAYVVVTLHLAAQPGVVAELEANIQMRNQHRNPRQLHPQQQQQQQRPQQQQQHQAQSAGHEDPATTDGFVRISCLADLERCLAPARLVRRPHDPSQAAAEMLEAGVGSQPAVADQRTEAAPESGPPLRIEHGLGLQSSRAARRARTAESSPEAVAAIASSMSAQATSRARHADITRADDRLPAEPPSHAWEVLDQVNLLDEFKRRHRVLQACPRFMRGRYRHAQRIALEAVDAAARAEDAQAEERAWKLFCLLSILLLHRPSSRGTVGKAELEQRCAAFSRGEWLTLLQAANIQRVEAQWSQHERSPEEAKRARRETCCARVRLEELSKARQALTSSTLAPGTEATLQQLLARPRSLTEAIPGDALAYQPDEPLNVVFSLFVKVLRAAPRGASGGPGGTTNEHLKIALDDEDTAALMHRAVQRLSRAEPPQGIVDALMSARMTALRKPNGKVRGIATGTAFRRLTASCVARIIGPSVEETCRPFQYALSTRAGTECVGHLFRAACDLDPELCVLSIDGIGAFDNIRRAAMLRKLASLPKARAALPFVRLSYATPTEYVWTDDKGQPHPIPQGEGGEQGDPLMPLLFALGVHDALADVSARLLPGEDLVAFLDDVYVLCKPERVRTVYDWLSDAFGRIAGIELHSGKTRVWNRGGEMPPRIADLGGEEGAWSPDGVVLLGVPVGTAEFVKNHAEERLEEERRLLAEIAELPDLQCAWQLLIKCAVPRGNYWIRTLPPSLSASYASQRDEALWDASLSLLHAKDVPEPLRRTGRRIAELPARMGGLGLRSTIRTAPAAYWASWADALEMTKARNPDLTARILARLTAGTSPEDGCLHELTTCAELLRREGFDNLPSWGALGDGLRPPPLPQTQDPTDRTPGWQFFASSSRENSARTDLLRSMCRSAQALLRSQSGPGASAALDAAPTCPSCTMKAHQLQAWIRRRLRWPLPLTERTCACGNRVDELGDHYGACTRSGRVKARATPIERVVAQICREAGARVRPNVKLRDLNIAVRASDERQIEVIASGLPLFGGSQLAVDVTLRGALSRDGIPRSEAHWRDGAAADAARADKESKYPELAAGSRCCLVVLALETAGRFSAETVDFLHQLAQAKALTVPSYLRSSTVVAFQRRWTRMLAVCAASSFTESLLLSKDCVGALDHGACREPWLQAVLTESRHDTFWASEPAAAARGS